MLYYSERISGFNQIYPLHAPPNFVIPFRDQRLKPWESHNIPNVPELIMGQ